MLELCWAHHNNKQEVSSIGKRDLSEYSVWLRVAERWTHREVSQMKGNGLNDEVLIMMLIID